MTREEQIKKQADIYTDDSSNYAEWSDDGGWSDINDIELIEKAFIEGAKWSDEHPNLYNNEKYHTVKVSCLDELNRKATLYDEFLEKACMWLSLNMTDDIYIGMNGTLRKPKFIQNFKQAMEG